MQQLGNGAFEPKIIAFLPDWTFTENDHPYWGLFANVTVDIAGISTGGSRALASLIAILHLAGESTGLSSAILYTAARQKALIQTLIIQDLIEGDITYNPITVSVINYLLTAIIESG